jgi:L,D-transpeptidase catalytic domain
MKALPSLRHLFAFALALLAVSCGGSSSNTAANQKPSEGASSKFVNPFPAGTYDNFKADPGYPLTSKIWKDDELLDKTDASNSHIIISIAKQRGFLYNGDQIVMDYPVSTGTESHPTPAGKYSILEKQVDKASNSYGKIYDAEGKLVNGNADIRTDKVPEGGKFEGAPMPYWMRLTWDGIGHHVGQVPRYPASHSCVRGPRSVMPIIFSKTKLGTSIEIQD